VLRGRARVCASHSQQRYQHYHFNQQQLAPPWQDNPVPTTPLEAIVARLSRVEKGLGEGGWRKIFSGEQSWCEVEGGGVVCSINFCSWFFIWGRNRSAGGPRFAFGLWRW
jgi:hypothetical protein